MKHERGQRRGAATPGRRAERVAGEVQRVVSSLLVQRVSDPRLESVVATRVQMTADLRLARIWVHSLAPASADRADVLRGLEAAASFFRRELASALDLRFTPDLHFLWDEPLDEARRIDALLREARASSRPSGQDEGDGDDGWDEGDGGDGGDEGGGG